MFLGGKTFRSDGWEKLNNNEILISRRSKDIQSHIYIPVSNSL